jgi:tetratricopeptide (TPR) repeat protein
MALDHMGGLALKEGKFPEAVDFYSKALGIEPGHTEAEYGLGSAFLGLGKLDLAIKHLDKAISSRPQDPLLQLQMAVALGRGGRIDEAIKHFAAAADLDPKSVRAFAGLGESFTQKGDHARAALALARAVQLQPASSALRYQLGLALARAGSRERALAQFREAQPLDSNWPQSFGQAAWALATSSRADERSGPVALELTRQAWQATGEQVPELADMLAAAHAEAGQFPLALSFMQKAIELAKAAGRSDLEAPFHERLLLYQKGQPYRQPAASLSH